MSDPDELDPDLFNLLDGWHAAVRAGRLLDRQAIRMAHPHLAGIDEALELLAGLAPDIAAPRSDSAPIPDLSPELKETLPRIGDAIDPSALRSGESRPDFGQGFAFGRYEILGELGRGGMGVVYRARQQDLDRVVALKMILANHLASPAEIRRFQAEAKAVARIRHPHVVQVHEAGCVQGQHYFAMEFLDGGSLSDRLRDDSFELTAAVKCVAEIARGVAHLHDHDIVHRDIKPANILFDAHGRPCLTDFGLVKLLSSDGPTLSGTVMGTPSYMAPEQASGRKVGPAADVYSLGAVLYELLTGRPPFRGATPLDTLVQVLEGEVTLPSRLSPGLPRELELVCLRCLEKAPEQRYSSAAALADDLDRFLRHEPVEARPATLGQRVQRWARRQPALAAHLGVFAVSAIVSHLNFLIRGETEPGVHNVVMLLLGGWAVLSVVLENLMRHERWSFPVRAVWLTADTVLLTSVLALSNPDATPLLVCYAVLIVASGLWFEVRLVTLTTVLSMLGYVALVGVGTARGGHFGAPHVGVLFVVSLAALGWMVGFQVQRVRVLSRFYEDRLPH